MLKKKLISLKKYINKRLKKGIIRKSKLLVVSAVLQIFKKNKTLRLCVDFRKFNNITILNKNLLSNISKLQNNFKKLNNLQS